jgi:opacity protein-like surface antigen
MRRNSNRTHGDPMRTSLILGAALVLAGSSARADEPAAAHGGVVVGAKVGGIAPFDGLSPFVSGGVEVGYAFGDLAIVLAVDYTQPSKTGTESDPRVMGGTYTWKITQQELGLMPVVMYRMTSMKGVIPYAGIGPRVLLIKDTVSDNGMPTIEKTTEQSTKFGVGVPLGAELPLGTGSLLGELLLQYGGIDHAATGDTNTAAASLSVGYRVLF